MNNGRNGTRLLAALMVCFMALFMVLMTGCAKEKEEIAPDAAQGAKTELVAKKYAIVLKSEHSAYAALEKEGFIRACEEMGVDYEVRSPAVGTAEEQREIVEALIAEEISGIVLSANDAAVLAPAVSAASEKGIPVVAMDTTLAGASLTLSLAAPGKMGTLLAEAAYTLCEGKGEFAILSAPMAADNGWIAAVEEALKGERYAELRLVKTANGNDDSNKSELETEALLKEHPSIKCIIAPTIEGLPAAARVAALMGNGVKVSGFGLPSDMAAYIGSGICPFLYMWHPGEAGSVAAYAVHALAGGRLKAVGEETLHAGDTGEYAVLRDSAGNLEIRLEAMLQFDETNINDWKDVI